MATWSPTIEGFRTIFRRPALSLAEVAWRWSFGAAASVLLGLSFIAYLDTLPVSNPDQWLLRTRQPFLISQAFSHILRGSALRVAFASVVLFSALALLWILFAALGRAATLAPLLEYIRERARNLQKEAARANEISAYATTDLDPGYSRWRLRSLAGLHFLRAGLALAACAGAIGAVILAGFASSKAHPHPATAFFLASLIGLLVWLLWSSVSWFLSIASIFVVRQGEDTLGAVSGAVNLCRERLGPVVAVGTWFGLAHFVVFVAATSVVAFPLALLPAVPLGLVLSAILLLTLGYFALVDTLYIGRLAGYVAILEAPPAPIEAPIFPPEPSTPQSLSIQPEAAMVDQNETILSDTPTLLDPPVSPPSALQSGAPSVSEESSSAMVKSSQSEATLQDDADPTET
jgi:hypothetical protein